MPPDQEPNETSPLLGAQGDAHPPSTGAIPSQIDEEQAKEPFPDARKQLKYIVPAISLGVRKIPVYLVNEHD